MIEEEPKRPDIVNHYDRRREQRSEAQAYFEIIEIGGNTLFGMLLDLNTIGLRVKCRRKIEEGEDLRLRINLSRPILDRDHIIVGAICRWCRPFEETGSHLAGFEIHDLSKRDRERIEILISSRAFIKMKNMKEITVR
jgi:hypothetical protein